MLVLNYGHPLTNEQQSQIARLAGQVPLRVIEITTQVAEDDALTVQATALIEQTGLSSQEWQQTALLVNLPGYSTLAACLLAEIEGRSGHLPAILKLRPVPNQLLTEYEVSEIINLQQLRAAARTRRQPRKES